MKTKKIILSILFLLVMNFAAKAIGYYTDLGTLNPGGTISQGGSTEGNSDVYGNLSPDYVYRVYISGATTLEVNVCGCGWDSYLHVLNSSDVRLAYDDDGCGNTSSRIQVVSIPSAGYYFIVVDGYGDYNSGSYNLNIISTGVGAALTGGTITIGTTSVSSGSSPGTITNAVSPSGGTGSYVYQWQQSSDNVNWSYISGPTSDYYSVPALYATTYYRRAVISGAVAYSNTVVISVTSATLSAGTITIGTTSVSSGSSPGTISSSVSPSGGTGSYVYQWYQSADNSNWSTISGATSESYSVPALYATTYYRRAVTSGTVAYSNTVLISITTATLTSGSITIGTTSVYSGSSPGTITNAVSPSGGTGSYAYQWQKYQNGDAGWLDISGATSGSYTVPALYATTYYRRGVTSGTTAYSDYVCITVTTSDLTGGSITIGTTSVSSGSSPGTFTNAASPSGGTGSYTYQWQQSSDNANWSNISGATSDYYSVPALYALTYYRRAVTSGTVAYSNTVAISVTQTLTGGTISIGTTSVSSGSSPGTITNSVSPSGGTGSYAYQWQQSSDNANWSLISGQTSVTYTVPALSTTTYFRRAVASGTTAYSNTVQITVTNIGSSVTSVNGLTGSVILGLSVSGNTLSISSGNSVTLPTATYPGAGIPISSGSAWTTSIANNSANWNTAYSWGNHSGLYRPISYVPAWSELTSKPSTVSGFGITDAMTTSHTANSITSANITTWNAKQSAITLTTTGTSGAATLVGNTLNIPQYTSGSGGSWTTSGSNYTTGSVSIGTTSFPSGYKLAVSGKIIAEEVMVKTVSTWPDYVFGKDYSLKSLQEVENHIKMYGHLPEVPSAQEVKENGIGLSEMDQILLKKMEEMTLYILDLEKRVKELETK